MTCVFIVDDQATNRLLLSKLASLIENEIEVLSFEDPVGALKECDRHIPDLIVTDYNMATMNGAEFISRLRALDQCHDIPIMVLTAYSDRPFRMAALQAGATDFLLAPVDQGEFVSRARNLLQLRKQQKFLESRATVLADELLESERAREEIARNERETLSQVINTVPSFIMAADQSGRCIFVNASQARYAGGVPSEFVGRPVAILLGDRAERCVEQDRGIFRTGQPLGGLEEEITANDGTRRTFATIKTPLRDAKQNIVAVVTISTDITSRKAAEARMTFMAHHDALTGLPNRLRLLDRMQIEMQAAQANGWKLALFFIDIDRFKAVNDGFGHTVGDWLLQEVASRLTDHCSAQDVVARLGGDEFAILQVGIEKTADAARLADTIMRAVAAPVFHKGHPLYITVSIGITIFPTDGRDADTLQRNADLAMYAAKDDGKNKHRFFQQSLKDKMDSMLRLEVEMRQALKLNQFVLHYQPQIDLRTGRVSGVEALLRWKRPGQGLLLPGYFLPAAEETGLITEIGSWTVRTAAQHASDWMRENQKGLRVAVNISPSQFLQQDVLEMVKQALDQTGLPPALLDLELTEGTLLDDRPRTADMLRALSARGVQFSIDDFGTGYASLGYFKRVSISRIKIDRSCIRAFPASREDGAIVGSAVALGGALGIPVLAEGVETKEELLAVKKAGCSEAQGFYFGEPVIQDQVLPLLQQQDASRGASSFFGRVRS
jgi:diguanylate cyclase (GGDEF)-like protein/PAS domain S-box-containing protein